METTHRHVPAVKKSILLALSAALFLQACAVEQVPEVDTSDPEVQRYSTAVSEAVAVQPPLLVERLPLVKDRGIGHPHLIRVGDLLEVDVYLEDSLDKVVRVDRTGQVVLPLIGNVKAAGRTILGFARALEAEYRGSHLQDPEITVFIAETTEPQITVDGAVNNPGLYTISDEATLIQVLALVGGFNDVADSRKVFVFRDYDGRKLVSNYNVLEIREGRLADPRIYEGDTIVAFRSGAKVNLNALGDALGVAVVAATLTRN